MILSLWIAKALRTLMGEYLNIKRYTT